TGVSTDDHEDRYKLATHFKDGERFYELVLGHRSEDWFFLLMAQDSNGHEFPMKTFDRDVRNLGGASDITEIYSLFLTRPYLDAAAAGSGLDIRFNGKRGRCFVKVPAFFVK